ncbi:hypothetical protein ACFLSJ_02445 [Verrucomicrobiota bacterium]
MKMRRACATGQFCLSIIMSLALAAAARADDPGVTLGAEDDLTVSGTNGTTTDADAEIKGFSVFGSSGADAETVTSGAGSVFIEEHLEVGSNVYVQGSVAVTGDVTSAEFQGRNSGAVILRGALYLDGGTGIFCRASHGSGGWSNLLVMTSSGNIGMGEPNPTNKLAVDGTIQCRELIVTDSGWSDFVFAPDYELRPLDDVEAYIRANGHLPDIPSAEDVAQGGVPVGRMQARLLRKIEELTLYLIELKKENSTLRRNLAEHACPNPNETQPSRQRAARCPI